MARGDDKIGFKKKTSGHGSITKAGKVRDHTPERGKKEFEHHSRNPKQRWKRIYNLLEIENFARRKRIRLPYHHINIGGGMT